MIAIKSERVVLPDGIMPAVIILADGIIQDVLQNLPDQFVGEIIDAGNNIVMPGVIDPHVHINEPGRTEWEGFETATKAAVAGGVTMLVEMPLNASPVTTTVNAFAQKLLATKDKLHTNIGFWGGVVPDNSTEIEGLINAGVFGFKAFLTHSGIEEFPNVTEDDLSVVMPIIAKNNLPLLVHCELTDNGFNATGNPQLYNNYLQSRPKTWEDDAIALMIRLCEAYNCRTHIVHLSSANSIIQIITAKQRGLPLTVETAQHYLYFSAENIPAGKTAFKCAPPIREKSNNEQLWLALKAGIIDFVATDHSPATPDLKEIESGDFMKAWGGIASIQFALPVLWTAAKERNCTFSDIANWLCERPAKLIGLQNSKGKIAKGFDADIIIVNDKKSFVVSAEMIHHKHKETPYLNEELFGVVEQTFLGGLKIYEHGTFLQLNKGTVLLK